jgi:hypothetical protein
MQTPVTRLWGKQVLLNHRHHPDDFALYEILGSTLVGKRAAVRSLELVVGLEKSIRLSISHLLTHLKRNKDKE